MKLLVIITFLGISTISFSQDNHDENTNWGRTVRRTYHIFSSELGGLYNFNTSKYGINTVLYYARARSRSYGPFNPKAKYLLWYSDNFEANHSVGIGLNWQFNLFEAKTMRHAKDQKGPYKIYTNFETGLGLNNFDRLQLRFRPKLIISPFRNFRHNYPELIVSFTLDYLPNENDFQNSIGLSIFYCFQYKKVPHLKWRE